MTTKELFIVSLILNIINFHTNDCTGFEKRNRPLYVTNDHDNSYELIEQK